MDLDTVLPRFADSLHPQGKLAIVSQVESDTPWSDELGRLIVRYSSNHDDHRYGLFPRIVDEGYYRPDRFLRTAPVPTTQTVPDYLESLPSRSGLARHRMADPDGFDAEVSSLLSRHAVDGLLRFRVIGQLGWGRPVARHVR
ncbi:hypothetical protein [Microlunatus parietis]|uniref:Uncharacterized protein n=1 Tax=Microlunatus parietis TaxID=682979 RepID=A0A7Y9IDY3_9ACTN|nr:hypothetical protein [Microlunatus parietis]NYE74753.1 hypothetical protein [Microlunatus parietis]